MWGKWILSLSLLILSSIGAKAGVWDTYITKLLFGANLQQNKHQILQTLTENRVLRMDSCSGKEFVEGGDWYGICIEKKFHFKKHPLFKFPFSDGIIILDTLRRHGELPTFQLDSGGIVMHIIFAGKKERDRGFKSLVNLFRPLSDNTRQVIDSPRNRWSTHPPSYGITLKNDAGSTVHYLNIVAGQNIVQIMDLKPENRDYAITITFFHTKPTYWLDTDKQVKR